MTSAGSEPDTRRSAPLAVLLSLLEGKAHMGQGRPSCPSWGSRRMRGPATLSRARSKASQDQDLTHEPPKDYKPDEGGCFKALSFGRFVTQQ